GRPARRRGAQVSGCARSSGRAHDARGRPRAGGRRRSGGDTMSGWDQEDGWADAEWEQPPAQSAPATSRSSSTSTNVFGVDVGGLAGEYVDAAVKAAVKKQVAEVADAAVE